MPVSTTLSDLSELALVACDTSYFTNANPVPLGSPLGPLDEGDPTIFPRFNFPADFFQTSQFIDPPSVSTGFKAIAYEKTSVGNQKEVIIAFGGCDGGLLSNPTDWVSSTQHLGWNQWDTNRAQIFDYLNRQPADTKITFTGQSLGGALAQYAAYEWIKSKTEVDPTYDKSRMSLITFNALGGYSGLVSNLGSYQASVLDGLGQAAHFVITGDMASRLGGDPTVGIGQVGGQVYLLDYQTVNPTTFETVKMDLVEAHRIETGFYAGLNASLGFTVAQDLFSTTSPRDWYFQMSSLQNTAGLLGGILNGRDVGRTESYPRLLAGLLAGMTFGDTQEWDSLAKAYLTNQYEAGKLSYEKYKSYSAAILPVTVAGKPATAAIYAASVILAGLADALGLGLDGIVKGFSFLKDFLQVSNGPPAPVRISEGEFSEKAALVLAASGALSGLNSLRQEFLANDLNLDNFAQQLLNVSGDAWRTDTLAYLRDQLQNPADKVQANGLAVAFYDTLSSTPNIDPSDQILFAQERDAFISDLGKGFANAVADFTQKFSNVAFSLGQTIGSFSDIQLIDQAYAAELTNPNLSSSGKNAIESARETFESAAQTVVVQQGIGPNPFDTIGFNPDSAQLATSTLKEEGVNTFTAYVSYATGTGGQAMQLTLNGIGANAVTVLTGGQELTPVNGVVTLVIPEGEKQAQFALRAQDLSSNVTVALDVQLVDLVNGTTVATHQGHQEATITAINTPAINYANGLSSQVVSGTELDDVQSLLGSFNYAAHGNGGNDLILSRAGNDQLYGDAGNDSLYGSLGHDQLYGGVGRDALVADFRDDYVPPSGTVAGQDIADGGADNDVVAGGGGDDHLYGGAGNDHIWGDNLVEGDQAVPGDPGSGLLGTYVFREANAPGNDYLDGGDGDDLLLGNLGNDVLLGGAGADKLFGDQVPGDSGAPVSFTEFNGGEDFLDGGDGNDLLQGDGGDDVLLGGAGNDQLFGDDRVAATVTAGNDWIEGGAGVDLLAGGAGNDYLDGGIDNDQLYGEDGDDVLDGGDGIDQLSGGAGNDDLRGGAGDDILAGHDGADTLFGEVGADQLDGGNNNDQLFGGAGNDVLFGQAGDDYLDGEENDDELQGGDGNDELVGDSGNDKLFSDAGSDTLWGDEGSDQLTGGTGNDVLNGGTGSDTYVFDLGDGQDVIFEADSLGDLNTIQFVSVLPPPGSEEPPGGISLSMLTFSPDEAQRTLLIQVGTGGDSILVKGFTNTGVNETGGIQNIVAGGISYSIADLLGFPSGQITGTGSNDIIRTGDGDDTIQAGGGNDSVTSNGGNDRLFGGGGDDTLNAGDGNDLLVGGSGNDTLNGDAGNDVLDGGTGNDQLKGGAGSDTFLFGIGAGQDTMEDADTGDVVQLGAGVLPGGVILEKNLNNLVLNVNGTSDRVTLPSFFTSPSNRIDQLVFADGTMWNSSTLLNNVRLITGNDQVNNLQGKALDETLEGFGGADDVRGGAGNDVLRGGMGDDYVDGEAGDDVLEGGPGRDLIYGGLSDPGGDDTLRFGYGDMIDQVMDFGYRMGEVDTIQMDSGIAPTDVTVTRDGGNIYLSLNGSDQIWLNAFYITSQFFDNNGIRVRFSDGTVWDSVALRNMTRTISGTEGGDSLAGYGLFYVDEVLDGKGGNDTLEGGSGVDYLLGGAGQDTYIFELGDEQDTIQDAVGEGNRILFGDGIALADLKLSHDESAMIIEYGPYGDTIRIPGFDPANGATPLGIDTIEFVDSTVRTYSQLIDRGFDITGTDENDILNGTNVVDRINGFAGQDVLDSGAGEDVLTGGIGNDSLNGGTGSDTYVFNLGDGVDAIDDFALSGEGNALVFGPGITRASLSLTPGSVMIQVGMDGDAVHLVNSHLNDPTGTHDVEYFRFADGTSLTYQELLATSSLNHAPTVVHALADQTVPEDATFSIQVPANTFTDADAGDVLTYSATLATGSALPSWLSFDAWTRTFTGTPNDVQVGSLDLRVTATDTGNLTASDVFTLRVQNVNEAPIVANPLPDQSTPTGQSYSFSVPTTTFVDQDAILGDTLTYSASLSNGSALPTWLSFNAATRLFSGTPGSSDAGLLNVKVTVMDTGSLSVADVFDLTVSSQDLLLTGTAGNDVLTGGVGNDQLFGLAGIDLLTGGAGNDLLDGGTGADTLRGGLANDTYLVDNIGDVVTENANEGNDTVQSMITYTLGANVENLTLTGTPAINGTGNALNNILVGNSGNNTLNGGSGNDRLDGGAGNDTMVGGTGDDTYVVNQIGDVVTETANQGTDTVESSITFTLGSNVENLTLRGTANINGTGSSANNVLLGNSGNNTLDAGSGDDTADGGDGNDTLTGGSGNDVLRGGNGIDSLDGGSGDDQLLGGASNDTMTGGSGADQLTGGLGTDTLSGGSGNDLYNFLRGDGQDTISDADAASGNQDRLLFGTTINPLDLVLSRQANDLRLAIHGTTDVIAIQNWYTSPTTNQIEDLQAGNGQHLLNTQVDQLIQAMASFSQQTGLTWDQGINQQPQQVQTILAASWH